MHDIGGQLSIVFNGEIYNYRELRQELVAKGHYNRLLWTKDMTRWLPRPVGQAIAYGATHLLPMGSRGRFSLQSLGADFEEGLPLNSMHFDRGARCALLAGAAGKAWRPVAEDVLGGRVPRATIFFSA